MRSLQRLPVSLHIWLVPWSIALSETKLRGKQMPYRRSVDRRPTSSKLWLRGSMDWRSSYGTNKTINSQRRLLRRKNRRARPTSKRTQAHPQKDSGWSHQFSMSPRLYPHLLEGTADKTPPLPLMAHSNKSQQVGVYSTTGRAPRHVLFQST